jgi:hypothetical protein
MELVIQFGYIVLFSVVFPLGAFMSLISNSIQVKSQMKNLVYFRRFKAEVSDGIGSWMTCLDTLSQVSIFLNCATLYFTSKVYILIFVGSLGEEGDDTSENLIQNNTFKTFTTGWDITTFLVTLILIEHGMLMLKLFLEQLIEDTPVEIVEGEEERQAINDKYSKSNSSTNHRGSMDRFNASPSRYDGPNSGDKAETMDIIEEQRGH